MPISHLRLPFALAFAVMILPAQEEVAALTKRLSAKDSVERLRAANELGKLGAKAEPAGKALARALEDEVAEVRNAAADALGKIGAPAAPLIKKAITNRKSHLAGLRAAKQMGPDAVELLPAITGCFRHETLETVDAIEQCLVAIGEPAMPHLIKCLEDNAINYQVAQAFRKMGPKAKAAVPTLCKLVGVRGLRVPEAAAEALGFLGDPAATLPLLAGAEAVLKQRDFTTYGVAHNAVQSLGKLRGEPDKVVPVLLKLLAAPYRDFQFVGIQGKALDALESYNVRTPEVLTTLREFLAAQPGENEAAAKRLLTKFGG